MNTIFFPFSLLTFRFSAPFFIRAFFLYSLSILHPNLPLVNLISDLLDDCLIKNLLEALWIAVNWDIIVHVSFLHKWGQLVRCRAFNVVVAAFLPDLSSFIVGFLPWNLSSKEWLPFIAFSRWPSSNLPQYFPKELNAISWLGVEHLMWW